MAQHKYSVGDRLRVLWDDAVCDAAVVTVHLRGVVDGVHYFLLSYPNSIRRISIADRIWGNYHGAFQVLGWRPCLCCVG